jgi:hypothetical protein
LVSANLPTKKEEKVLAIPVYEIAPKEKTIAKSERKVDNQPALDLSAEQKASEFQQ